MNSEQGTAEPGIEDIADTDELWRRLHSKQVVAVEGTGQLRISSAAFTDPELSVDLARLVESGDFRVTQQSGIGVAAFNAADARGNGLTVVHDPLKGNVAHSLVIGRKSKAVQRQLARAAKLLQ